MNPERWKQIDEILQQALSQLPANRETFLNQTCAGDTELRREVESLLEHDGKAEDFIASPPEKLTVGLFPTELPPGTRIASYTIEALLGSGGMGVVYRARDERLDRDVALKILPNILAPDPDRLARFEREAKAVAALSHPNILGIYDFGNAEGVTYAAMELLEGETLRARLQPGALPVRKAIDYAVQMGQGLAAAHERGIVHRDLKPENVFLTKQGRVKILDFGLAKLRHFAGFADEASGTTVTEPGVVMGTVGYMSPEQVRGQEADARSDIFSFGAILYEMLSGRRAFQGNSAIDTRSAILKEDPPELCIAVSPAIERVVRRCLEKNPDERLQTARDVSFALEAMSASRTAGWTWLRPRYLITTASALAVMAIALAWMYWRPFSGEPSFPPMETVPITSFPGVERSPSFSPDGNQIAFTWNGENRDKRDIYVVQVGGAHPFHLTSGVRPAWSPDSREIAFIRFNPDKATILSIGPLGGPERKLAEGIIDGFGLNWAPDGKHLAFSYKDSQQEPWSICSLSVDTLQGERLTSPPPGSYGDRCPAFSPDGSHLGFVRELAPGTTMDLYVLSLSGGEPRRLTADGRAIDSICWTADSREIVFQSNRPGSTAALWRIPVSGGGPQPVQGVGDDASQPDISAKGRRLAYVKTFFHSEIYRIDLTSTDHSKRASTSLIASSRYQGTPWISPDGNQIAFGSNRSGSDQIWTCNSEGTKPVQLTNLKADSVGSPSWSPDGRFIAFDSTLAGNEDIFVINVDTRQLRAVTKESSEDVIPTWSRDGRWIYFGSNRSGTYQVWKTPAGGGKAVPVTKNGGLVAYESLDGRFVYFAKQADNTGVWRVPVEGGPESRLLERIPTWAAWAVAERGIYFRKDDTKPRPSIEFFDFATQRVRRIALVKEGALEIFRNRWLSVSPDEKWLVYHGGTRDSDIMMVDHFR